METNKYHEFSDASPALVHVSMVGTETLKTQSTPLRLRFAQPTDCTKGDSCLTIQHLKINQGPPSSHSRVKQKMGGEKTGETPRNMAYLMNYKTSRKSHIPYCASKDRLTEKAARPGPHFYSFHHNS